MSSGTVAWPKGEAGKVISMTLYQGGLSLEMPRDKPKPSRKR